MIEQLKKTLLQWLSTLEVIAIIATILCILTILTRPAWMGELAACWFDTFMFSFLENISGNY
jgi:hypothetical protein